VFYVKIDETHQTHLATRVVSSNVYQLGQDSKILIHRKIASTVKNEVATAEFQWIAKFTFIIKLSYQKVEKGSHDDETAIASSVVLPCICVHDDKTAIAP
jgi:hypothetical protein